MTTWTHLLVRLRVMGQTAHCTYCALSLIIHVCQNLASSIFFSLVLEAQPSSCGILEAFQVVPPTAPSLAQEVNKEGVDRRGTKRTRWVGFLAQKQLSLP